LHAIRRQRHLQEIKHAVFLEQARQQVSKQKNAELLAQHAEYASRNARAFASFLGKADAWAVKNDEEVLAAETSSSSSTEETETVDVEDKKPAAIDHHNTGETKTTPTTTAMTNQDTSDSDK
jgi:hypothetical protein